MATRPLSAAGSAAAMDLGLHSAGGPGSDQNLSQEEQKRRKKLQAQMEQKKQQANSQQGGPFTGAFMSLTGNQY